MDSFGNYGEMNSYQGNGKEKDFHKIAGMIGTNIQKISHNVVSMKKMLNIISSCQDSQEQKHQLQQIQHYTNDMVKDTGSKLRELTNLPLSSLQSEQREFKAQKTRLAEEFAAVMTAFQDAQHLTMQMKKEDVQRNRAAAEIRLPPPPSSKEPMDLQMMAMEESEVQRLQELAEEDEAIDRLERDILDVNLMFKDFATMIHSQGQVVDSIESYVENSSMAVEEGFKDLTKANKSVKQRRKKLYICYSIIIVIVICILMLLLWR